MNPATFNFLIALFENIVEDVNATDSTKKAVLSAMADIIDKYEKVIS